MKNNPLITLLASLNRREMTRFAEFALSPFFNKHKEVRALAVLLSEIYPEFTDKKCGRATLYQNLYPGQPHQQPQLAIVFSYTVRLLEQFLVVEALFKEGRFEDKSLYSSQLRKRNLIALLKTDWQTGVGKTDKNAPPTQVPSGNLSDYYEKKFRTTAEQDAVSLRLGQPGLGFLEEKQGYLDAFYLTEKLRDACEICQRSRLLKAMPPDEPILDGLLKSLVANEAFLARFPPVNVYLQLYNLLKNSDLERFSDCVATVQANERHFDREEAQNLYNYLQNFCIEQINRGNPQFLQEVFRLYQLQLDNHLLLVDGVLPEWHYKNIVTTGLRLDERNWVHDFIKKYRPSLAAEVAENAYSYNLAAWFYHVGKPQEVLPLLLQVEYTDLRYNLDAKSLLLRTYFDLEEEEALQAHAEAFSQFVKRNKSLTDFQKKGYFNFIRFAQKAFRLTMQQGFFKEDRWREYLQKLESDMAAAGTVFNRTWLETKVEGMKLRN